MIKYDDYYLLCLCRSTRILSPPQHIYSNFREVYHWPVTNAKNRNVIKIFKKLNQLLKYIANRNINHFTIIYDKKV